MAAPEQSAGLGRVVDGQAPAAAARPWPAAHLVDRRVSAAAAAWPEPVAVVDGAVRLTYQEFERRIRAVAAGLAGLGVGPGEVVSWQLPNWHEALVLHHAVLRLGALSNPIVPIYRSHEVGYILREAGSRVVVVPETFRGFAHAAMVAELAATSPALRHVVTVRSAGGAELPFEQLLAAAPGTAPVPDRTSDDPILLMFTSGTTAAPKGVLHTHRTLDYENRSIIDVYGLSRDDVVFMPSPVTHITGLLYGVQLPAMLGTRVVLQEVWDPTVALGLIEAERATFTVAATPFLHGLVHHPELASYDVSSLRVFACGGADVPPSLIRDAGERLGCAATRVYGSTEFPTLSTSPPDDPLDRRAGTDGRAIAAAEYRIVDDADADLPVGTVGELLVRGPELFPHYLRPADDEGTRTADGWFRTGDLAVADVLGYVSIRGRRKDIILRGGENISVTEVEEALFEHPSVGEVAVVAMPDPVMVERGCAFVVPAPGAAAPTLADLAEFLTGKGLARQKLPERLELVDALPRTQSGKVQKFRLRERIRELLDAPRD
jgi:cyclohexanecarboxylate-CoA ligase